MEIILLVTMGLLTFVHVCMSNKCVMLHSARRVYQFLESALALCRYLIRWLEEL